MRCYPVIVVLTVLLAACSEEAAKKNFTPPAVPVLTAEVQIQDVPLFIESLGTLKPTLSVEVRPQVSGLLAQVHIQDGQFVKKGTPLFTIDSQPYKIKLQEAVAQLAQDKATLEAAEKKWERHQSLSKQDLIPQQEWDNLKAEVAKARGQVQADEAKVASARLDVERCTLASPIDGKVGKIQLHPGNLVSSSQTTHLVTITQVDPLVVDFALTEQEFQQLTPEHKTGSYPIDVAPLIQLDARSSGKLTFLDATFDAQTGLLPLRGLLPNPTMKLLPGQCVRVYLTLSTIQGAKIVPQRAVKINQDGPYVYVVKEDQTVELRQVILGDEREEGILILEGLAPGDVVITEGHLRLMPGAKVAVPKEAGES